MDNYTLKHLENYCREQFNDWEAAFAEYRSILGKMDAVDAAYWIDKGWREMDNSFHIYALTKD